MTVFGTQEDRAHARLQHIDTAEQALHDAMAGVRSALNVGTNDEVAEAMARAASAAWSLSMVIDMVRLMDYYGDEED